MKNSNIIAAGRMLSIALILLGVIVCAGTFTYFRAGLGALAPAILAETLYASLIYGASMILCGVLLMTMFPLAERFPPVANPVLVIGVFVAAAGIAAVAVMPGNPFYWIMALICVPVFIDTLCLKINLDRGK